MTESSERSSQLRPRQRTTRSRLSWNRLRFDARSAPLVLLIVCLLAYGLLSPFLGFYQDDWNFVYQTATGGFESLVEFFHFDGHPTGAWSYVLSFKLLGFSPVAWQVFSVFWRYLSVLTFWLVIDQLWPARKVATVMAAVLFAVYPVFYLQAQAVSYFEVWLSFSFLWLSFLFSLKAVTRKDRLFLFTALAVLMKIGHSFTTEYTWGLELVRPLFFWFLWSGADLKKTARARKVLDAWWPYLLIFLAFTLWRGFFYTSPTVARSEASFFFQFLQDPLSSLKDILSNGLPDMVLLLISGWYRILQPGMLDLTVRANAFILLFVGLSSLLIWGYLAKLDAPGGNSGRSAESQIFLAGLAALLFGLLPFYAAGYFISSKLEPWNGRFALGSMPGVALMVVAAIQVFISNHKPRLLVFALLGGLSIGWQVRMGNQFRWGWERQVEFYTQLYHRAPMLEPGTSLLSETEFLSYMGGYPTSYAINTLYAPEDAPPKGSGQADYWFFPLSDFLNWLPDQLNGRPFSASRASVHFQGDPGGSIEVAFESGYEQCLWVIRPEYADMKALSQTTRQLAAISYMDRILPESGQQTSLLLASINPHPQQDWCYFYEKADLASQFEDWDEVIRLWEAARQKELGPDNGFEYLPFIAAYARTGDWQTARQFTRISQKTFQGIEPLLCSLWDEFEAATPASEQKGDTIAAVREDLRCGSE